MNTTENNKLIAEFLNELTTNSEGQIKEDLEKLDFHYNWNSLIRAVEKIESIKLDKVSFGLIIEKNSVTIYYCHETEPKKRVNLFFEWGQKTKIGNTYKIVCSFIEWYNKQTAEEINKNRKEK